MLLPPLRRAATIAIAPMNNPTGLSYGRLRTRSAIRRPARSAFCRRRMAFTGRHTVIDTPDDLYCKLPQDRPDRRSRRRNYPCMGHPGKRAPTVESATATSRTSRWRCASTCSGPYPLDPNLDRTGRPARRQGVTQRQHLRADRRHTNAVFGRGCGSATRSRRCLLISPTMLGIA